MPEEMMANGNSSMLDKSVTEQLLSWPFSGMNWCLLGQGDIHPHFLRPRGRVGGGGTLAKKNRMCVWRVWKCTLYEGGIWSKTKPMVKIFSAHFILIFGRNIKLREWALFVRRGRLQDGRVLGQKWSFTATKKKRGGGRDKIREGTTHGLHSGAEGPEAQNVVYVPTWQRSLADVTNRSVC